MQKGCPKCGRMIDANVTNCPYCNYSFKDIDNFFKKVSDDNYIEKIDNINENNVNTDVAIGASKIAPQGYDETEISKKYKRNPLLGKIAIQNAYYCCERSPTVFIIF